MGLAGCSAILGGDDDGDGDGDGDDGGTDGDDGGTDGEDGGEDGEDGGEDGDGDGEEEPDSYADKAQSAWETVINNPSPDQAETRNQAFVEMEEAVRDDMVLLPLFHGLTERMWYDHVDTPKTGALGGYHQVYNTVSVEGKDTLNLIGATMDTLDPIAATDTASAGIQKQLYETLVHYPNGVPEMENQLLDSFELSDDGMTLTLTLVDDATFHDGSAVTAADAVYSIERLALSSNSSRASFVIEGTALDMVHETSEDNGVGPEGLVPDSLGLSQVDENTIEIEMGDPNPSALDVLTYTGFSVIPEGYVGDHPDYEGEGEVEYSEFSESTANGSGAFEFDMWTPSEERRVVRNDDYHGDVADVSAVHWAAIEDDEAAYTYVIEQNADIFGIPTAQYDQDLIDASPDDRGREVGTYGPLDNGETVNYLGVSELSTFYWGFNFAQVPRPVRRAVAYVTNHEELVQQIFEGRGVEAFSFTPPPIWPTGQDGYEEFVDDWPYSTNETDIQSATQILQEAGHTSDDPFSVQITTYESEVFSEAAELTREKLAGTGVEAQLEQAPFGTLLSRGRDGNLQMYSLGWIWSWESVAYGLFGFEPKNTDTDDIPTDANGYYLDWNEGLDEEA